MLTNHYCRRFQADSYLISIVTFSYRLVIFSEDYASFTLYGYAALQK